MLALLNGTHFLVVISATVFIFISFSDVSKWLTENWQKLGPAVQTMDLGDIRKINKEAFDGMIDYLGEMDGWSVEKAQALVLKAKEFWNERGIVILHIPAGFVNIIPIILQIYSMCL